LFIISILLENIFISNDVTNTFTDLNQYLCSSRTFYLFVLCINDINLFVLCINDIKI